MNTWKQAYWLAMFELKQSKLNLLLLLIFLPLIILGFIASFESYLDLNFVGIDFYFILSFTFAAAWTKPKYFQVQQLNDELVASPTVVMLQQLPISKELIIKSRFIIYFIYSFPPQILLLIALYLFTPTIQGMMDLSLYIVFAIMWLSFGVYMGGIIPSSDAGDRASPRKVVVYAVLMLIGVIAFFTIFHIVSDYGIVHLTLIIAKKWPILSGLISVALAYFGFIYWQSYMKKLMEKLDYL